MNDHDDVLAAYEAELASDPALQALVIKLSWQPKPRRMSPDAPEQTRRDE
jgi:hypothetical protein